jgi:hypothetical protein
MRYIFGYGNTESKNTRIKYTALQNSGSENGLRFERKNSARFLRFFRMKEFFRSCFVRTSLNAISWLILIQGIKYKDTRSSCAFKDEQNCSNNEKKFLNQ